MPADLLTVAETAELTRRTPGAIYASRYRGEAPGVFGFPSGRQVLFRRADIERWLDQQRRDAQRATDERLRRRRPRSGRGRTETANGAQPKPDAADTNSLAKEPTQSWHTAETVIPAAANCSPAPSSNSPTPSAP